MRIKSALRWCAGLGVVGALVATTAIPAAAKAAFELDVFFQNQTLAAGSAGKADSLVLYVSEPTQLSGVRVTYDWSDLAGKLEVEPTGLSAECNRPSEYVLACIDPGDPFVDDWGLSMFDIAMKPTAAATVGTTGTLKVSVGWYGSQTASHVAKIRIGEAVDVAAGPEVELSAGVGDNFSTRLVVTNPGDAAVRGVNVVFDDDHGFKAARRFGNCTYKGGYLRTCAFDVTIGAGEAYAATLPYTVPGDAYAPGVDAGGRWVQTRAEFEDFADYLADRGIDLGESGNGAALTLTKDAALTARGVQSDVDPSNNWTYADLKVTGKNGADLAAVGGTASGAKGDKVTAKVGVVNNGPASLINNRSGSEVTRVDVVPPPGTTVVGVPESCYALDSDGRVDWDNPHRTGAARYRCWPGIELLAGQTRSFELGLRFDKVVANAKGLVEVNTPCECEGFPRELDLNPANDKAALIANPSGGSGGGLPVTGPTTALIAGGGAALLLAGVGGYLLARRRRLRFTA
jgi:hypothetical protein